MRGQTDLGASLRDDRNPVWDETLELEVPYFVNGEMRVEVMDCDEIDDGMRMRTIRWAALMWRLGEARRAA